MYVLIPNTFFVLVCYSEDILNIKKTVILKDCDSCSYFPNKITKRKELLIGISLPIGKKEEENRWVKDRASMEKYAKEKGVTVKVESDKSDVDQESSQVENLIAQGIDVLILAPLDSAAAAPLVEKAHKAGIKVIAYDRIVQNSDLDLYISFNNIRVGELQGAFLVNKVPKGNYIIMSGDPKDSNSKLFKDGAMEYIEPRVFKRDINIVTDQAVANWDPKNAFKIVEDSLIATNNNIDAILAPSDNIARVAIEALQAKGLAGKVIVTGQDAELPALRRIVQGTQSMTVLKDARELGKAAIDAAIKLAEGKGIDINGSVNNGQRDVPSILLTPIAVDKENLDNVIIKSGYFSKEQVYSRNSNQNS